MSRDEEVSRSKVSTVFRDKAPEFGGLTLMMTERHRRDVRLLDGSRRVKFCPSDVCPSPRAWGLTGSELIEPFFERTARSRENSLFEIHAKGECGICHLFPIDSIVSLCIYLFCSCSFVLCSFCCSVLFVRSCKVFFRFSRELISESTAAPAQEQKGASDLTDPRHGERIVEQLGLGNIKGLSSPGVDDDDDKVEAGDEEELFGADITLFRGPAARCNYLSMDRADIQHSAEEICREMATPVRGSLKRLTRLSRYLVSRPRLVCNFK